MLFSFFPLFFLSYNIFPICYFIFHLFISFYFYVRPWQTRTWKTIVLESVNLNEVFLYCYYWQLYNVLSFSYYYISPIFEKCSTLYCLRNVCPFNKYRHRLEQCSHTASSIALTLLTESHHSNEVWWESSFQYLTVGCNEVFAFTQIYEDTLCILI